MLAVPPLPTGVVVQFFHRQSGYTQRVTANGRYLVTPPGGVEAVQRPVGIDAWEGLAGTETELTRLMLVQVVAVGFFDLPAHLGTLSGGQGAAHPLAVTVRHEGRTHTVEVVSRGPLARNLGALTPLYAELDRVAIGSGRGE